MIGKLSGILDSVNDNHLILDVQGVGYVVFASNKTLSQCHEVGAPLSLLIDTHVREDHIHLYGFMDAAEQEWFRLLTSIQGVGAKAALAILTVCPPEQLGFAIAAGDKPAVQRADGVGPKIAARIITELKDKAAKMDLSAKPKGAPASTAPIPNTNSQIPNTADQDAVSALINLGYQRSDAYAAVMNVKQANDNAEKLELSDMIRLALKELSV
ncbi:MAG: Holliday junction branch migration protein RuvA [Alphaproteobacteria bacterium]|nr:Holliday junction branch migration protein RuvA [Alphaproteobacteria bacterium]